VIADKGYDSRRCVLGRGDGGRAVIPTLSTRKEQREVDKDLYRTQPGRTLLARLKDFRRVATRYEKTDRTSSPSFSRLPHRATAMTPTSPLADCPHYTKQVAKVFFTRRGHMAESRRKSR